jgi:hypothetical protein
MDFHFEERIRQKTPQPDSTVRSAGRQKKHFGLPNDQIAPCYPLKGSSLWCCRSVKIKPGQTPSVQSARSPFRGWLRPLRDTDRCEVIFGCGTSTTQNTANLFKLLCKGRKISAIVSPSPVQIGPPKWTFDIASLPLLSSSRTLASYQCLLQ